MGGEEVSTHKVSICEYLPKTVKDKDGVERELFAVAVDDKAMRGWLLGLSPEPARIVLFVGGVVPGEGKP